MNKTQRQNRILEAIENIESGKDIFACHALGCYNDPLVDKFSEIFRDPLQGSHWTFFSLPDGTNESPFPPNEERKNVRLTALWLFYHMQ